MAADLDEIKNNIKSITDNSANITSDINTMLSVLQRMDTSISTKKSGKNTVINSSGITTMLKSVNAVNPKFNTLSSNLTDVNNAFRTLSKTLAKFNQNFSGSVQTPHRTTANTPKNSNGDASSFMDVKDILNGIKAEIENFHKDIIEKKQEDNGNSDLDKKLSTLKEVEKTYKKELEIAKLKIQQGIKLDKKDEDALKAERERQKRWDKYQEKEKGKSINASKVFGVGGNIASSIAVGNIDSSSMINNLIGLVGGPWGMALKLLKGGADIYNKEESFGRDYSRTYGGGKYGKKQFMRESANFRLSQPLKYGFTAEDYYNASANFSNNTGRQIYHQTHENIKAGVALRRMGIEGESLSLFDTFGWSLKNTDQYFNKLYGTAGRKGLSFKKMTDAIKNNIKMAQTYTFSKGVNGLQKMAETSTRLKYNMSEVAKFAEKVNTVEGSIKAAASLSVLGGDFAQFSNPMGLMYEGLNDMEALNERMVDMFSNMAYFDKGKGQIDIGSYDKIRIRAAAEAMGVDANEMMNIAMNRQREQIIAKQVGGRYSGETLDYIKNLAQLDKNGKAYIADQNGKEIKVGSEEFAKLIPLLKKESEKKDNKENASLGDVFIQTQTIYDFLNRNLSGVSGKLGALVTRFIGGSGAKMTDAEKTYYNSLSKEQKQILYDKYGKGKWYNPDKYIKQAIAEGQTEERVNTFIGGDDVRRFFDDNAANYRKNNKKEIEYLGQDNKTHTIFVNSTNEDFLKSIQKGEQKDALKKYFDNNPSKKNHVGTAGVQGEHLRILQNNESVLTGDATRRLGIRNVQSLNSGTDPFANSVRNVINEKFDYLKSVSVIPSKNQSSGSAVGTSKIAFEPLTLNLTGQFNLVSPNGQFRNISLDDIDTRALKKAILDTVTENIPTIMRKTSILNKRGYDMEHDPYRGAAQVPYI